MSPVLALSPYLPPLGFTPLPALPLDQNIMVESKIAQAFLYLTSVGYVPLGFRQKYRKFFKAKCTQLCGTNSEKTTKALRAPSDFAEFVSNIGQTSKHSCCANRLA